MSRSGARCEPEDPTQTVPPSQKKKIARTRGLCRLWAPGSLHVSCKISLQEVKRGSYGSEGPDECSKDTETVQEYVFFSMAEHDSSHCWWYSMNVVPGVNKGIGSTHCACYRQRHRQSEVGFATDSLSPSRSKLAEHRMTCLQHISRPVVASSFLAFFTQCPSTK